MSLLNNPGKTRWLHSPVSCNHGSSDLFFLSATPSYISFFSLVDGMGGFSKSLLHSCKNLLNLCRSNTKKKHHEEPVNLLHCPPIGITTLLLCFFVNAALGQSGQKYATGANNLDSTDKFGSKNFAPVRIVTDNIERARFTEDGLFGLGTSSPIATFDLSGSFRYRNGSQQSYVLTSDANGNAT